MISDVLSDAVADIEACERGMPHIYGSAPWCQKIAKVKAAMTELREELDGSPAEVPRANVRDAMSRTSPPRGAATVSAEVVQLPDLARMRALSDRVRVSSDEEVAEFLCTEDGQWLFTECAPMLDDDVARRLCTVISEGLPPGSFFGLLGLTPEVR